MELPLNYYRCDNGTSDGNVTGDGGKSLRSAFAPRFIIKKENKKVTKLWSIFKDVLVNLKGA